MSSMNKTMFSILKVLDGRTDIIGSKEISKKLKLHGVDLTERTVRYHLKILDERGLTQVFGKEGRRITGTGREELKNSLVSVKVGFVSSTIETLSYLTSFDMEKQKGNIILNISYIDKNWLKEGLKQMKPVFRSPYVMSDRMIIAQAGEAVGDGIVPEGKVAIGSVCSVTINGILLKAGIPVVSRFGGVLQIEKAGPSRFSALISYDGSSLDPLEIFIRSGMTDVLGAVKRDSGKVLASFREVPVVCVDEVTRLAQQLTDIGMGGILLVGNPNQPLLEMPVSLDKAGIIVVGGLNPIAALEEAGIPTRSRAMSTLYEYSKLISIKDALKVYT